MSRLSRYLPALLPLLVTVTIACPARGSTVLTFQSNHGAGGAVNLTTDPQAGTYGDNVSNTTTDSDGSTSHVYGGSAPFTPNTTVSYTQPAGGGFSLYQYGNDWAGGVAFFATSSQAFNIIFTPQFSYATPATSYGVRVNSFVLDDFDDFAIGHTLTWTLLGAMNEVLASGVATVATNQELSVSTGMNFFYKGGPVTLSLVHTAGNLADLAIDTISFDEQLIPEPSGLTLIGATVVIGMMRRRRAG